MLRIISITLAITLLLIGSAAFLASVLLDKDKILELATAAIHEETGATLLVQGQTNLSLFPTVGIALGDASLTMPGKERPDLHARALEIGVQLLPLFSGKIEINTISLDGLVATMESAPEEASADTSKLSDEQLDAFYAAKRKAIAAAGDAAGAEIALAAPLALNVQHLIITDSRLEIIDPATHESTLVELVKLETTGLNLDGDPVPLALEVRLPGEQAITISLEGKIQVDQQNQKIVLKPINLVVSGATAKPITLKASGTVDLTRQIADLQLVLELGETHGEGTLRYASFESPQIDANLQLDQLNPALLVLAGPSATEEAAAAEATTGDEPLPLDAIRLIDTRAELTIAKAVLDKHTVNNLHIKLRAVDGVIDVSTLTGDLHGGKLDLKATFNGKHNTAALNTTGGLTAMDIATTLAAVESDPLVTGTASLSWQLSGKGRSANELTAGLSGPIKLTTEQVVLKDMSVENMVCQAVALTNQELLTAAFPANTRIKNLSADIQLDDGKAQLQPLLAELQQMSLKGTGAFNLLSQDFKASFKATLSPELEELDPACRVSKRLTAIDWPVNCKGNTSGDPAKWCSVDTEEIIQDLTKNEAQKQLKKKAGKLLDSLFK